MDPFEVARQQSDITNHFRARYREAKMVAKGLQVNNVK
jgi:hypothetical protein